MDTINDIHSIDLCTGVNLNNNNNPRNKINKAFDSKKDLADSSIVV